MINVLYNLFVMPIQMLIEMIFSIMYRIFDNKGIAIIAVSIMIQTLILPLYKRSDAMQEQEAKKQSEMAHWVKHIKKTFKGDERFMMLSTYYRQQNYKAYYGLKSSVSILLQVPFFIAGYNYLSHLKCLQGASFLFINDLGQTDGLISIMGMTMNLLPILMTIFNVASGVIYTKGQSVKVKLQVYGLALLFLILLYNSPSGLVLYWTMNNLYSLLKNVVMKILKKPIVKLKNILKEKENKNHKGRKDFWHEIDTINLDKRLFFWEMLFLTVLLGYFIPVSVLSSSAAEFVMAGNEPGLILLYTILVYAGIFFVWCSVFYMLMTERARKLFLIIVYIISGMALFDYMVYGGDAGMMNALLEYTSFPKYTIVQYMINALILCVIVVLLCLIIKKNKDFTKRIMQICILCMAILSGINTYRVHSQMEDYRKSQKWKTDDNSFSLSKEGTNVVVIMIDRAISAYIPYIFEEKPEIKEAFSGFTYYPNTISFGLCTNYASPALFGGYEYTPVEMDARSEELLADKHNEAISVLPVLFAQNDYKVTVADPPYAGYKWTSDLSIYDEYEGINAYMYEGAMIDKVVNLDDEERREIQNSHFVYYSMVRVIPISYEKILYNNGNYFVTTDNKIENEAFYNWYTAFDSLCDLTKITDDASNTFLMLQNSLTHEPVVLDSTDYIPVPGKMVDYDTELAKQPQRMIDEHEMKIFDETTLAHYQTNLLAYQLLANWIEFLKENDVYDNTRIIIASDHGRKLHQFDYMQVPNGIDIQEYNPVLLIKDFNSDGFMVSNEFMTNADVPTYAVRGIIEEPYNPFTGKLIDNSEKFEHPQYITTSTNFNPEKNNGYKFDTSDGEWYEVEDDIFDWSNWVLTTPR